jgi:acyl-coenzyme A thioesterase PaaI-like protein
VTYYRTSTNDHLYACVWFGRPTEGPPNIVHGGAIAAVLDEAMGAVCWMNGHPVIGARITINYLQAVPLEFSGHIEAQLERIEGRKCFITSRLTDERGTIYAQGEALFVKLAPEALGALQVKS